MTYIYYINLVVIIIKQHKVTFCSCKFSQKNNIEPHKNFTGSYEKSLEVIDEFQLLTQLRSSNFGMTHSKKKHNREGSRFHPSTLL